MVSNCWRERAGVVEGGIGVDAGDLENLEIVIRSALGGDRIGLLEDMGGFLGGGLCVLEVVFRLRDTLVSHLVHRRRYLRGAEFWRRVRRRSGRSVGGVGGWS